MVLWDEERLLDRPVAGGRSVAVDISSSALTPGLHRLTIERVKTLDDEADRKLADNTFSQIELEEVRKSNPATVPVTGNAFIASFLDFGVTGQSDYRLDGCLFDGPQRLVERVACDAESPASFTLENRSREPAVFTIVIGDQAPLEFEVEARGKRRVEFSVPAGEHDFVLEVAGYDNGSFLWGGPALRRLGMGDAPSIVFITLDTTRWDSMAPFSTTPALTPNLRAFAAESTVFSNAWAVAPWTLPSHASMFTGLYPSHHGAGVTGDVLDSRWVTLAERFRDAGYVTGGFIGGHMSSSVFGLAQGFSEYHDPEGWERRGDLVTESALDFIEANAASPQFVFINYFDPHEPYLAPKSFNELAGVPEARRTVRDVPVWCDFARGDEAAWVAIRGGKAAGDPQGLAFLRATYLAEVAFVDAQLGRVFDKLRELEIYDDALIILVADHGEFLGERGRYSHSYSLDPELTKVPMLIKWPQQRTRVDVDELVSQVDLYPAVASAMDLDVPASDGLPFAGTSLSALKGRAVVLMEEHSCRIHPLPGRMWIADHLFGFQRRDTREVIFADQIRCEILRDGAWTSAQCDMDWEDGVNLLGEKMRAVAQLAADHGLGDLDPAEAEKLRALGYIE
jgi:arylsulfatase A-like enzyme